MSGALLNSKNISWMVAGALMLGLPLFANNFFVFQIAAQSLALGIVALSLVTLAGFGGMLSLSQMTVAGIAGYAVAIVGVAGKTEDSINFAQPWYIAVLVALVLAVAVAVLIGFLAARTQGIYTMMSTLALGVAFFYLAQQNLGLFNGFQGIGRVYAPTIFGINFSKPNAFYYLCLVTAASCYVFVIFMLRTPFGLALLGVRDNPRRMSALGFNVYAHRVAAHAVAGVLAALGGVLLVWYNGQISPGSISASSLINILVLVVLGGMHKPLGAFVGALAFVLVQNFAIDIFSRDRFNLVIGTVFLIVLFLSPKGLVGIGEKLHAVFKPANKGG